MALVALVAICGLLVAWAATMMTGDSEPLIPTGGVEQNEAHREQIVQRSSGTTTDLAARSQVESSGGPVSSSAGGGPASSPSLLGVSVDQLASSSASQPQFRDEGARLYYTMLMMQKERLDEQVKSGRVLADHQRDQLAINTAVRKCVEEQRFWYLGPKEQMPAYAHLQTAATRYIATVIGDHGIIIELTRNEFPEVFEYYARFKGGGK